MPSPAMTPLLETGVPNLDLILGGGIPCEDVLLVIGLAGTGKTTLCLQMLFAAARRGENVLYVSTVSEPTTKLLRHLRSFDFYDENLIGKKVFFLNAYPLVKQSLEAVAQALIQSVQEHQATVVVIDGLMSLHDLHPNAPEVRTFIYELGAILATMNCTTVVTSSGLSPATENQFPEFTMADGIIVLDQETIGARTIRRIQVRKIRGQSPVLGWHGLRIDRGGITVYPRLESVYEPRDIGIGQTRMPTGIPELDALMSGGPYADSTTLLAGALGTGKTLASLQFIMEGAKRGEKGLFVGFRETKRQLIDKAKAFQMDLEGVIKDGRVVVFWKAPVDLDLDQLTWEICQEIDRFGPTRLAMDSVSEIENLLTDDRSASSYMAALAGYTRGRGTTALIVREIAKVIGPELDFSDSPLSVLADNLILMRWVEFRSELYRIISVLKMRDSAYDASIRQYTITDQGIHVMRQIESAEGLLTGVARLTSEARWKPSLGR